MEQTDVMFLVGTVGVVVFIALLRWALGPLLPVPPPSRNPMNSVFWNLHSEPQSETLRRALAALGRRQPEESVFGQLEGWTWRAVEGNPAMTVRFDENSIEDRHLSGHIVGTPGTLAVACSAHTTLSLIDGLLTLTRSGQPSVTLGAGDALKLPSGFEGMWQNKTTVYLHFAVTLP